MFRHENLLEKHKKKEEECKNLIAELAALQRVSKARDPAKIFRLPDIKFYRTENPYLRGDSMIWDFKGRRPLSAKDHVIWIKDGP